MRIIRGRLQRRIIHVPAGLPVRPTTDLAKESLFNIIDNLIGLEELRALDLFSGTGSISYELVSRGCASVTAVDIHPRCVRFIADTAKQFDMPELRAVRADVFRFLQQPMQPYHVIFADPPYEMDKDLFLNLPVEILGREILHKGGLLVIEHPKNIDYTNTPGFIDHRNYSKVNFSFFRA
ncbi:MAG TPA: RsmD family RNA methyltransferase [Bacteroidales bacterium]|nr:RsmD family RNA methyltransferase [Bacteroidales bacterium]